MEEEIHLYDVDRESYPRELGTSIRSVQVHVCPVCGAKTNQVVFAGGHMPGARTKILCPHYGDDWHIAIGEAIQVPDPDHAAIAHMRAEIAHLATDDIVGEPDFSQVQTLGIPEVHRLSPEMQAAVDDILARARAGQSTRNDTSTTPNRNGGFLKIIGKRAPGLRIVGMRAVGLKIADRGARLVGLRLTDKRKV